MGRAQRVGLLLHMEWGIYLSEVEVRQGRAITGGGGDRIGSVGRGLPGRVLTMRLR